MVTDTGVNLLSPGDTPHENAQFLLFLVAVIQAVDDYQGLLRMSVATAGNDHRLGANEAPPAVISMFLGDELTAILKAIEKDEPYNGTEKKRMKLGVDALPRFTRDTTDRNRTSPFAFTGNKFEFRMLGSSNSIACANIMLNTAVAESLRQYADRLEQARDFNAELHDLIKQVIVDHKRVVFNGNGYDEAWIQEAEKRGLLNLRATPEAMEVVLEPRNMELLLSHKVFSEAEIRSRYEIQLENYCKTIRIEALTMVDMAKKQILPAVDAYASALAAGVAAKGGAEPGLTCGYGRRLLKKLSTLCDQIDGRTGELEEALGQVDSLPGIGVEAAYIRDEVLPRMAALREPCDQAEACTAENYWPFPTYGELLFGVK